MLLTVLFILTTHSHKLIKETKMENQTVLNFLNYAAEAKHSESAQFNVPSRKVSTETVTALMSYTAGGMTITGVIHDQSVSIIYNYYRNRFGYYVTVDGKQQPIPVTLDNLIEFINTGKFLEGTKFTGCPNP